MLYFIMIRDPSEQARRRLNDMRTRSWELREEVRKLDGWMVLSMMEKRRENKAGRRRGKEKKAMKGQR